MTNAEIRRWYRQQCDDLQRKIAEWQHQGVPLEEQARRAHQLRHDARLAARRMMRDPREVVALEARDLAKYGHPDGPAFEQLLALHRGDGCTQAEALAAILESATRTESAADRRYAMG